MPLFFLFVLPALPLSAQNFPSLDAAPEAYEYARRFAGGAVRWNDVAEASLWASSVNAGPGAETKAASYMQKINAAAAELSAAADLPRNSKERGEYVLGFLHKRFLKSYSEYQTRVDEVFISGRYNCVSSAVLYMTFCIAVGLDAEGVMTKDHAFITVNTGTERIDVETTNQYGFDPGNRKEFHDAFGKATGFAYVPVKNYRDRTALSASELVSLILSNRIAILEKNNRFAEAVPLAINRAVFLTGSPEAPGKNAAVQNTIAQTTAAQNASANKSDFFEDPQNDMMNRFINLGAYYIKNGKEDDAIAWTEYAGKRFPADRRWQELIKTAANNKLVKLVHAKKIADARSALTAIKPKLSDENYGELDALVLEAEAAEKINAIRNPGDVEAALAFIEQKCVALSVQLRGELRTAAILSEADRYGKARDWAGGMRWVNGAMEKYGSNAKLESVLRTLRQNRISELHNEFAALFNKRDYNGAKASVQRSLQEFPGEKQLVQDLILVEKALAQ